ncbi:hypothetical protein LTR95_001649 [Oleoguttula sp. CCFEE 5521]
MSDGADERDETTRPLLGQSRSSARPLPLRKPTLRQRQSSTFRYHTFPTAPPRHPSKRTSKEPLNSESSASSSPPPEPRHRRNESGQSGRQETPLPKRQLAILAVIALCEQTALNSISPYLPEMASTFPEVRTGQVGLYVGLIASSFAAAQFATNFAWGWLSDRIGRKPVVLCGTILTAACFVAFGFCRTLWQAIMVQVMMGLVNGNQGVISTCLGEITDRSNQSKAFTYLPVIYGLGGITGPIVGGLLVMKENPFRPGHANPYPYLLPNLLSAGVLLLDFILTTIFLEESLEEARDLQPLGRRVGNLFTWIWQFTSSHRPTSTREQQKPSNPRATSTYDANGVRHASISHPTTSEPSASPSWLTKPKENNDTDFKSSDVFNRDTILLLLTFLIFQLCNISFNSLYPIFAQGDPPTGRDLNPKEIGISLAFAGLITILFQIGIFGRLRESVGNKATYRTGLAGFIIAFILVPFVGYKSDSKLWLWIELGGILVIKTISAVGGLTSALLLITNSAPSHAVLGRLNGLAQTLSAAGRGVGPFISGGLFTAATRLGGKGELLPFGTFAGVAAVGFALSWGIRGKGLEGDGWEDAEEEGDEEEGDTEQEDRAR